MAHRYKPMSVVVETNPANRIIAEGERRLWLAVITSAGEDIVQARTVRKAEQALAWFLSTSVKVGSFNWVCGLLELESTYWRRRAIRMFELRRTLGKQPPVEEGTDLMKAV